MLDHSIACLGWSKFFDSVAGRRVVAAAVIEEGVGGPRRERSAVIIEGCSQDAGNRLSEL